MGTLAAAVAALAFVGDAGALLDWHTVRVTPKGPSPRTIAVVQGVSSVAWVNDGARARQIVFADGSCRVAISSSVRRLSSKSCVTAKPGRHPYRIVGLSGPAAIGVVVVRPLR